MFTGIVEEVGRVAEAAPRGSLVVLTIAAERAAEGLAVGDSLAVNGVCLTAVRVAPGEVVVEAVPETLRRTNLGGLAPGDPVNLERSLTPTTRLGGHFVQGHVDATGEVLDVVLEGASRLVRLAAPPEVMRYVVPKGFVAVDGASLTVAEAGPGWLRIAFIPHTLDRTVAGGYRPGSRVNLEADVLGKYVEHLLAARLGDPTTAPPDPARRSNLGPDPSVARPPEEQAK